MIKGIRVKLINRTQNGVDEFNTPKYTETEIYVDNVLVSPTSTDDIINQQNLTGRKAVYTLAIPKGDTNAWENQFVEFYGKRFHVFSMEIMGIDHLIPLNWNAKVYLEEYAV